LLHMSVSRSGQQLTHNRPAAYFVSLVFDLKERLESHTSDYSTRAAVV
jgi:hypothetical protein